MLIRKGVMYSYAGAFFIVFLSACSSSLLKYGAVDGLSNIPQDVHIYSSTLHDTKSLLPLRVYKQQYFQVWNTRAFPWKKEDILWPHKVFHVGNSYGENFQKIPQEFFDTMKEEANYKEFATLNKKAFSNHRLNLRAFPTDRMLFRNPQDAGEGFPFDYLQNSSVAAMKPLRVSHYSKSKEWVFVTSSFAYGWVKAREITLLDETTAKIFKNAEAAVVIKDNIPIYNREGKFLFRSQIGMLLPQQTHNYYIAKGTVSSYLLPFNSYNIDNIIRELQKNIYGWGGMYQQRDCSSTIRDFFAPFGVWLPRNSAQQARVGRVYSLEGMDDREKLYFIQRYALPFQTLLYKTGHIVLYVGVYQGKIVVFHNTWGIKTQSFFGKDGRFIIGKTVFTTLDFGYNLDGCNVKNTLLHQLKSMNIIRKSDDE